MANENDVLVLAYYPSEEAAAAAAGKLKDWDKANDDIKLGAIGVITMDETTGGLLVDEIGQRNTRSGALWGTAIGFGIGLITGGIGVIPGMALGAALGGGVGALDHKSLGMSDQDVATLKDNLKEAGAALGVMCDDFEVNDTEAKLIAGGGTVAYYYVPQETKEAIRATVAAQVEATTAVDEAFDEVEVTTEAGDRAGTIAALAAVSDLDESEAEKLHDSGVEKASTLLEIGATPQGRSELAEATGIDEESILGAVKKMDLMRIKGVGVVYAELLHASGVETVPDLARRNPANLAQKMAEVNESAAITEELPSEEMVTDWVSQAKDLPRMISY